MTMTRDNSKAFNKIVMAILTFVVVTGCFLWMAMSSFAASEAKITATAAKIRKDASTTSDQVGSAQKDEQLPIVGEVTGNDGKVWYKVSFDNGTKTGYIRSDLATKVEVSDTPAGGNTTPTVNGGVTPLQHVSAKVSKDTVRVRTEPATGSIVSMATRDMVVTVTGQTVDSDNKIWYQISYTSAEGAQVTGFVRNDFLEVQGAIVPAETTPVVDPGTVDIPDDFTDVPEVNDTPVVPSTGGEYEIRLEDSDYYLVDHNKNEMYLIQDMYAAIDKNKELYEKAQKTIKTQKTAIIVLAFCMLAALVAATFLFFKYRDAADAAYFEAVEKDTIRQRQNQRANNGSSKPAPRTGGNKPATGVQKTVRPAEEGRPAGEARPARPAGEARPAGARPARPAGEGRPAGEAPVRPARPAGEARPARPTGEAPRRPVEAQEKPPVRESKPAKNFMAEDDDFEFEFLNWDSDDK